MAIAPIVLKTESRDNNKSLQQLVGLVNHIEQAASILSLLRLQYSLRRVHLHEEGVASAIASIDQMLDTTRKLSDAVCIELGTVGLGAPVDPQALSCGAASLATFSNQLIAPAAPTPPSVHAVSPPSAPSPAADPPANTKTASKPPELSALLDKLKAAASDGPKPGTASGGGL